MSAKHLKDMVQVIIYSLEEALKVLDFVLWLNSYYFVLLDSFPLFLHFLTFLIKFALWTWGEAYEAKAFLQTRGGGHGVCPWGGPAGSCSVSTPCRVTLQLLPSRSERNRITWWGLFLQSLNLGWPCDIIGQWNVAEVIVCLS